MNVYNAKMDEEVTKLKEERNYLVRKFWKEIFNIRYNWSIAKCQKK